MPFLSGGIDYESPNCTQSFPKASSIQKNQKNHTRYKAKIILAEQPDFKIIDLQLNNFGNAYVSNLDAFIHEHEPTQLVERSDYT